MSNLFELEHKLESVKHKMQKGQWESISFKQTKSDLNVLII